MAIDGGPCLTLLEILQVPELHQVVAVVIVGDVDLGVLGDGVFHPGPLVPAVAVMLLRLVHRGYRSLTVHVFLCGKQTGNVTFPPRWEETESRWTNHTLGVRPAS